MKRILFTIALLMYGTAAFAAEPYILIPSPSDKVQIGEAGKWSLYNLLQPGKSVVIKMQSAAEVTLTVRKVLKANDAARGQTSTAQFGITSKTTALALSAQEANAVISKSKDKVGKPEIIRQSVTNASSWTLVAPSGEAPLAYKVESQPIATVIELDQIAAKKTPLAKPNAGFRPSKKADDEGSSVGKTAFFVEPRPGFFIGKGALSGFRGELAAGYYPGILDGAFAVVMQGGYYGATGEDKIQDEDVGTITRNWDMTAIPVGASVRWHFLPGSIRPYVSGGLEYTRVSFEYTASIPAGPLQEPKTTGLNSFLGPRGALGGAMRLGPGVLNAELAYSYAYLPADTKGDTGKILAPVIFIGYAITFGESSSFEETKHEQTALNR